jgi:hypothetical protein
VGLPGRCAQHDPAGRGVELDAGAAAGAQRLDQGLEFVALHENHHFPPAERGDIYIVSRYKYRDYGRGGHCPQHQG